MTGAAGGIGLALVEAFHGAGYLVIATDLAPSAHEGLRCDVYVQADLALTVTDAAYAAGIFAQVRGHLGGRGLDVLVNNAATQILGGVDDLSRADWQHTLNVNLVAPFLWTQALLPALEQSQGSVVNVSSVHARLTKPNFVAYATSKAALSGMTRAMAVDLAGRVRVNAIEPAAIATEMLKAGFSGRPEALATLAQCHPQGRIGTPEEVATCALLLANDACQFLHGTCVALDGGIGARLFDPL